MNQCREHHFLLIRTAWTACLGMIFLAHAIPAGAEPGFDPGKLAQMETAIRQAIAEHRLPGGVLWVESRGSNYHQAIGLRAVKPSPEPMTLDTIFDVASLTKVLATTPAIMLLRERGALSLEAPVADYLPEFTGGGKEGITIRHLLTHTSGFRRTLDRTPDWSQFPKAFAQLCAESPPHPPGLVFQYSDLNFIILGVLVERLAASKLDAFVTREVFQPLKMIDTGFLPESDRKPRIAPTEKVGRHFLRGMVHDPKARDMGGVAGHAGVFSTAADIARFARMLLNRGELDGVRILQPESVRLMTSVQSPGTVSARRGLGWDIDSEFSRPRGNLFPLGSYGMTGFTGVCLWLDPYSQSFWMLLSNRVHPEPSGNIYALQRTLATLAAEAIRGFDFHHVPGALPPKPLKPESNDEKPKAPALDYVN